MKKELLKDPELIALSVLLIGVTVSIQFHAVLFWKELIGSEGIAWSITIELVAIFAWFLSGRNDDGNNGLIQIVAIGATIVALSGPAVKNIVPIIENVSKVNNLLSTYDERLSEKIKLIDENRYNLSIARENSKSRMGWKDTIDRSEENINRLISEKDLMLKNKPSVSAIIVDSVKGLLITLTLVIFQLASVLLTRTIASKAMRLSGNTATNFNTEADALNCSELESKTIDHSHAEPAIQIVRKAAEKETDSSVIDTLDDQLSDEQKSARILEISSFVSKYKDDHSFKTIRDFAKAGKVNEKNLSLLINHEANLLKRKENPNIRVISFEKATILGDTFGYSALN